MTIKFNVSEQDYINFNIDHSFTAKKMKPATIILRYFPAVLFFVTFLIKERSALSVANVITAFIFCSMWIVFFTKIMKFSMKRITLAYIKSGKANDFIGEQVLKLTDNYIEESNSSMVSQIQYSSIERIYFGHGLFYIYIGAIKAIIIPAAAFSDEEQKITFFNILSQKTGLDFSSVIQLSK